MKGGEQGLVSDPPLLKYYYLSPLDNYLFALEILHLAGKRVFLK